MTVAFVSSAETWPEAAAVFPLAVIEDDGEPTIVPQADGKAEICVVGPRDDPKKILVAPTLFSTIDQARRAGAVLAEAFAQVRTIAGEDVTTCVDHEFEEFMLARELKRHRICVRCGTHGGTVPLRKELAA